MVLLRHFGLGSIISVVRRIISQSELWKSRTSGFEIYKFGVGISVDDLKIVKEECLLLF